MKQYMVNSSTGKVVAKSDRRNLAERAGFYLVESESDFSNEDMNYLHHNEEMGFYKDDEAEREDSEDWERFEALSRLNDRDLVETNELLDLVIKLVRLVRR